MSFQQVYYTSCATGLRGGKGFQINAATPTIDAAALQQVERLSGYEPPPSAPKRPSSEAVERFPISLLFHRLHDQSAIVAQAKYVATDYSGRFGNYFTHTLVTSQPMEEFRKFLPIELWRSPVWTTTESPSTSLSALEKPELSGSLSPVRVQEFITQGRRGERLPAYLTAVEQALCQSRQVVIVDDGGDGDQGDSIALWIAVATYALPRHMALDLTFNTYVKNPYQTDALIIGTTSDTEFSFSQQEIGQKFCVFDFHGSRFTPLSDYSDFACAISAAYQAGHAEQVAGFANFIERVAPKLTHQELAPAFAAYSLLTGLGPNAAPESIARWCAVRIERMEPAQAQRILASLISSAADHASCLEAAIDLYCAAVQAGAGFSSALELPFWEWLLRDIAGSYSPALLKIGINRLQPGPIAADAIPSLKAIWQEQLTRAREPARLCVLLELGEQLGLLAAAAERLKQLGELAIAPALDDPTVQQTIKGLARTVFGSDLIEGIGTYFLHRSSDSEALQPLRTLLSEQAVLEQLKQLAVKTKSPAFCFWILGTAVARSPEKRLLVFQDCLASLGTMELPVSARAADMAVDVVWGQVRPTVEEANGILRELHDVPLDGEGTQLLDRLFQTLQLDGDLLRPRKSQDQLVSSLAAVAAQTNPTHRRLLDAHLYAVQLRAADLSMKKAVAEASELFRKLPKEQMRKLLELLCERLLESEDPVAHAELLEQGHSAMGPEFAEVYREVLERTFLTGADGMHDSLARHFTAWDQCSAHVRTLWLEETLPSALTGWPRAELDKIEDALAQDPPLKQRFHQWRRTHFTEKKLLGIKTGWLFVCAILLGLMVWFTLKLVIFIQ